jgi:hypothetical protein
LSFHFGLATQRESKMQQEFGRPVRVALAFLAVLIPGCIAAMARADGLTPSPDAGRRPAQCGGADQDPSANQDPVGCARIRGYIAAGSDFKPGQKVGGLASPFDAPAPPIVKSVGVSEPLPIDAPASGGSFLLQVSHDEAR